MREVTLKTALTGNFRLLVVEERFDQKTGERYLFEEDGTQWVQKHDHTND